MAKRRSKDSRFLLGADLARSSTISSAPPGNNPPFLGWIYIDPERWAFVNDRATRWYLEEGGITTICWHWGAPDIGTGYENAKKDFDLPAALHSGTPQKRLSEIVISPALPINSPSCATAMPVLWRPLHEFTDQWFWWGKHGSTAFKELYLHTYDYFTNTRGLNNLFWVAAFSGEPKADWYPGHVYVDIVGPDTYVKSHDKLAPSLLLSRPSWATQNPSASTSAVPFPTRTYSAGTRTGSTL